MLDKIRKKKAKIEEEYKDIGSGDVQATIKEYEKVRDEVGMEAHSKRTEELFEKEKASRDKMLSKILSQLYKCYEDATQYVFDLATTRADTMTELQELISKVKVEMIEKQSKEILKKIGKIIGTVASLWFPPAAFLVVAIDVLDELPFSDPLK